MIEDITNEEVLDFTGDDNPLFLGLTQLPSNYIEQVRKLDHPITVIRVNDAHSQEFYESLRELVSNCDDNVCIKNGEVAPNSNKDEFFLGEQIIDEVIAGINPEWKTKSSLCTSSSWKNNLIFSRF